MSLPTPILNAIDANLIVLNQGIRLLSALGAERYGRKHAVCFQASVGGHMRHIIEHYQSFLHGLDDGEVDYERRARDPLVEADPDYANGLIDSVVARLLEISTRPGNPSLHLCAETTRGIATSTSVLRELEFLLSHTIHHYALVAVMARLQGCEPEPTFGIAPSTLRHQRAQAAALCAP